MGQEHIISDVDKSSYSNSSKSIGELNSRNSDSEDEKHATLKKKTTKTIFSDIMGEARGENKDTSIHEKKKKDTIAHTKTPQTHMSNTLPSTIDLKRVQQALHDGSAFQRSSYQSCSTYHPPRTSDLYHPEHPKIPHTHTSFLPKSSNDLTALFSKRDSPQQNYSSVSFCDHIEFYIDWAPHDPENRHSTFRPSFQYFEDRSPWSEHKHCAEPDVVAKLKKLAMRIVGEFEDLEKVRVERADRRSGVEARRAPPVARVEREVSVMYSWCCMGRKGSVGEKEKEKVGGKEGVDRVARKGKTPKKIAEERVARKEKKNLPDEKRVEPLSKNLKKDNVTPKVIPCEKRKRPAQESREPSPQPEPPHDNNEDSSSENSDQSRSDQTLPTEPDTAVTDSANTTDEQEHPPNKPTSPAQPTTKLQPTTKKRKPSSPPPSPSHSKSRKRKVSPTKDQDKTPPRKKTKKTYKSAAVIEDSDEEANYELPKVTTEVSSAGVRLEWEAEAEVLVEEVVAQRE